MPGRRDIIAARVRILVIAPLLKQYIISALIIFPHDPDMNSSVQCALHDVPHRVLLLRLFYFHPHLKYRKAPTLLHPELPAPEYPACCIQALKKRTPSAPLTDGRKSGRLPKRFNSEIRSFSTHSSTPSLQSIGVPSNPSAVKVTCILRYLPPEQKL